MQNTGLEAPLLFVVCEDTTAEQISLYKDCLDWFDSYLDQKFQEENQYLLIALSPILEGNARANAQSVRKLISWIARVTASLDHAFLGGISQEFHQTYGLAADDDSLINFCQSIFVLCGWITLLYKPQSSRIPGSIQMHPSSMNTNSGRFRDQPVYPDWTIVDEDLKALSFQQLLACFGLRVPRQHPASAIAGSGSITDHKTSVTASNIFFSNLVLVGKVEIQWVDSLIQHLDFDERTRTLKIFKYPAYCTLICLSSPKSTDFLNRLIEEAKDNDSGLSYSPNHHAMGRPFDNFCREVLISFGIIFGQDRKSREMAQINLRQAWPIEVASDRILRSICGTGSKGWKHHPLFHYLVSPPLRANYSVNVGFPLLGEKLLQLHEFMDAQSPNDFRTLFFDRRDHLRYWSFICLLGLGVASIALQTLQVLLAIVQVILAA
ncbi:hypothetical protein F5Y10DRAFT_272464 [Nemania abortiva]|nr:hypothetical protein F5Y10DRAFT_272464 [Nemania abortiva]